MNLLTTCRALITDRDRQPSETWCNMIKQKVEQSKQRVKQFAFFMTAKVPDNLLDYLDPFLPPKPPSTPMTTPADAPNDPLDYLDPFLGPKPNQQHAPQELDYSKLEIYHVLKTVFAADSYDAKSTCLAAEEDEEEGSVDSVDWLDTEVAEVPADLSNMLREVQVTMRGAQLLDHVLARMQSDACDTAKDRTASNAGSVNSSDDTKYYEIAEQEYVLPSSVPTTLSEIHSTVAETDSSSNDSHNRQHLPQSMSITARAGTNHSNVCQPAASRRITIYNLREKFAENRL